MKGKIIITITLGLMCFVLVTTMFMQFKTINETDITSIKNMREAELRTEIANWKTKYEEAKKKYEEISTLREEYKEKIVTNQEATELIEKELNELNIILGLTDVKGDGIIVTLSDNSEKYIEAFDILQLVNELRLAGAEAISVNNQRIVNMSDIVDIANSFIVINGQRLTSPYVIKAIGNQAYLESGLTAKQYGYMDKIIKGYGKTGELTRQNNVEIYKYAGEMTLENIK